LPQIKPQALPGFCREITAKTSQQFRIAAAINL